MYSVSLLFGFSVPISHFYFLKSVSLVLFPTTFQNILALFTVFLILYCASNSISDNLLERGGA